MARVLVGCVGNIFKGDDAFGVVLVGCKGRAGAEAFYGRFQQALARVTRERPATPEVGYSIRALAECDSPEEALEETEGAVPA